MIFLKNVYWKRNSVKVMIDGFQMPFDGHLSSKKRWVNLAAIMLREQLEKILCLLHEPAYLPRF